MVPLQNTHDANEIVEEDRMLLISGTLSDSSFGNASSVLFDGQKFIPYLLSSSSTGALGSVSSLIHSLAEFSFTQRRKYHFLLNFSTLNDTAEILKFCYFLFFQTFSRQVSLS